MDATKLLWLGMIFLCKALIIRGESRYSCHLQDMPYSPETFKGVSKYFCLIYSPGRDEIKGQRYAINVTVEDMFIRPKNGSSDWVPVDHSNFSNPVFQLFSSHHFALAWIDCCKQAEQCCEMMQVTPDPVNNTKICRRTWDGLTCFENTPSGTEVDRPCPLCLYPNSNRHCTRYSTKRCLENGTWYRMIKNKKSQEHTFYEGCLVSYFEQSVYRFAITALSISVFTLITVVIIFSSYKQLNVPRFRLHKNLSVAVLCCSIFNIVDHALFNTDGYQTFTSPNEWWCKLLTVFRQYFWVSQYTWMLCEGFYLHRMIASAFAQQMKFIYYMLFGWGFPGLLTIVYAIVKECVHAQRCYKGYGAVEFLLMVPSVLCLAINTIFLCHVIYVLITKLKSSVTSETHKIRKVARAVMFLIPAFGIHFLVLLVIQSRSCYTFTIIQYVNWVIIGFQGFLVSILFCYLNEEVHYLLKRSYLRYKDRRSIPRNSEKRGSSSVGFTSNDTRTEYM